MIYWKWMNQCVVHSYESNEVLNPLLIYNAWHGQLLEAHTLLKIMCIRENMKHLYRKRQRLRC